ncbi:MAG: hypothetical protein BGO78_07010 [Chloroflexi bacterium 44-23]|nr:MAG: hypothetical protein BGO78_07010 [Chloroflexi bacterium 44-23]
MQPGLTGNGRSLKTKHFQEACAEDTYQNGPMFADRSARLKNDNIGCFCPLTISWVASKITQPSRKREHLNN